MITTEINKHTETWLTNKEEFLKLASNHWAAETILNWSQKLTNSDFKRFYNHLFLPILPKFPYNNRTLQNIYIFYESQFIIQQRKKDPKFIPTWAADQIENHTKLKQIRSLAIELNKKQNILLPEEINIGVKNSRLNKSNQYYYDQSYTKHYSLNTKTKTYDIYIDTETYVERADETKPKNWKLIPYAIKFWHPSWPKCRSFLGLNVVEKTLDFLLGINPHYDKDFPETKENINLWNQHVNGKIEGYEKHYIFSPKDDRKLIKLKKRYSHKGIRKANLYFYNANYDLGVILPIIREKYWNLIDISGIKYTDACKLIPGASIVSRPAKHQLIAALLPQTNATLPPLLKDADNDRDLLTRLAENRPIYETWIKKYFSQKIKDLKITKKQIQKELDEIETEEDDESLENITEEYEKDLENIDKQLTEIYELLGRYQGINSKKNNTSSEHTFINYIKNFDILNQPHWQSKRESEQKIHEGRIVEDHTFIDWYEEKHTTSILNTNHSKILKENWSNLGEATNVFSKEYLKENHKLLFDIYNFVIEKTLGKPNKDPTTKETPNPKYTFKNLLFDLRNNTKIKFPLNFKFNIVDLWLWNKTKSLEGSLSDIVDITFKQERTWDNKENKYTTTYTIKDNETAKSLYKKMIECYGNLTNKELVKKVNKSEITYVKYDMFLENGEIYYLTSPDKDDTTTITIKEKFDYDKEDQYLETDVKGLHLIKHHHDLVRKQSDDLIRTHPKFISRKTWVNKLLKNPTDPEILTTPNNYLYRIPWTLVGDLTKHWNLETLFDPCYKPCRANTIPSAALNSVCVFIEKNPQEIFRQPIIEDIALIHQSSYLGGFTAAHKYITKITPENYSEIIKQENNRQREYFKKTHNINIDDLRPTDSSIINNNRGRIISIDVNSMYPWAMTLEGLPGGHLFSEANWRRYKKTRTTERKYVRWITIKFTDWVVPPEIDDEGRIIHETGVLYRWKKQYDVFNNSFLGNHFSDLITFNKNDPLNSKIIILEKLLDLFVSCCDIHYTIDKIEYQELYDEATPFFQTLYEIKRNPEGKYTESEVATAKLTLNSSYGKLGEKHRETYFFYTNSKPLIEIKKHRKEDLKINKKDHKQQVFTGELTEIQRKEIRKRPIAWTNNLNLEEAFLITLFDQIELKGTQLTLSKPIDQISPEYGYISQNQLKDNRGHLTDLRKSQGIQFIYPNTEKEQAIPVRPCILAGLYVTSLSRHLEIESIIKIIDAGHIFLYGDTDSIKIIQFGDIKNILEVHDSNLGAWKFEGSYTHFWHNNKRKKYALYNSLATIDNWSNYIKNPKKHLFSKRRVVATGGLKKNHLTTLWWSDTKHLYDAHKEIYNQIHTYTKTPTQEQIDLYLSICKTLDEHWCNHISAIFSEKTVVLVNCKRGHWINTQHQTIIRNSDYKFKVLKKESDEVLFIENAKLSDVSKDKSTKEVYKKIYTKTLNTVNWIEDTKDLTNEGNETEDSLYINAI